MHGAECRLLLLAHCRHFPSGCCIWATIEYKALFRHVSAILAVLAVLYRPGEETIQRPVPGPQRPIPGPVPIPTPISPDPTAPTAPPRPDRTRPTRTRPDRPDKRKGPHKAAPSPTMLARLGGAGHVLQHQHPVGRPVLTPLGKREAILRPAPANGGHVRDVIARRGPCRYSGYQCPQSLAPVFAFLLEPGHEQF
jgi:hypothetical protein